jgi:hypothetical protein
MMCVSLLWVALLRMLGSLSDQKGYDLEFMKNIRLIDAWPEGRVEWELEITSFYANLNGMRWSEKTHT